MPFKRKCKKQRPGFRQKKQSASPLIDGIARFFFFVISLWCIYAGVDFVRHSVDPKGDGIGFVFGIAVILFSLNFMLWIISGVRGNQPAPRWGDVIARFFGIVFGLGWFYVGVLVLRGSVDPELGSVFSVFGIAVILLSLHFMLAVMGWVRGGFWWKYGHYFSP